MLFISLILLALQLVGGDIGFRIFSIGTIEEGQSQALRIVQESINNLNDESFYCLFVPANNQTFVVRQGDSESSADVVVSSNYGPLSYVQNELNPSWPPGVRTGNIDCPGGQGNFNSCEKGREALVVRVIDDNLDEAPDTTASVAMGDCAMLRCVAVTFVYAEDEPTKNKNPGDEFLRNQECFKDNDQPTYQPTSPPTTNPTNFPSNNPSKTPTNLPSKQPTEKPTDSPSKFPTKSPSDKPTTQPTKSPSGNPTNLPTKSPSDNPTQKPTDKPTAQPTNQPSKAPTSQPTDAPSNSPTNYPTVPFWCSPDGGVCRNGSSFNYEGIDGKKNFIVANIQECETECQKHNLCTGFDFISRDTANNLVNDCFLFKSPITQVDCGVGLTRPNWILHTCCKRCPNGISSCGVPLPVD